MNKRAKHEKAAYKAEVVKALREAKVARRNALHAEKKASAIAQKAEKLAHKAELARAAAAVARNRADELLKSASTKEANAESKLHALREFVDAVKKNRRIAHPGMKLSKS
ncbi:MAG: hypothetical protein GC149_00945 [Gammaproteobacteria bacterium]|nr:hypothetical protein [Gammaproteobacteria bacterium]